MKLKYILIALGLGAILPVVLGTGTGIMEGSVEAGLRMAGLTAVIETAILGLVGLVAYSIKKDAARSEERREKEREELKRQGYTEEAIEAREHELGLMMERDRITSRLDFDNSRCAFGQGGSRFSERLDLKERLWEIDEALDRARHRD